MSATAYPTPIADAAGGGTQVTVTQFTLSDSAVGSEVSVSASRVISVKSPISIPLSGPYTQAGGVLVPVPPQAIQNLITANQLIELALATCMPLPITIRGITVYYHCPYETVQPSLLNNRKQIALAQFSILSTWIRARCYADPSDQLCTTANAVYNELTSLPTVNTGDYVDAAHYNALFDYVAWAMSVIRATINVTTIVNAPIWNALTTAFANMAREYTGNLLHASRWNALTSALAAIDQFLAQYGAVTFLPLTVVNPSYTYPSGQQIPIQIPISVLQQYGIDPTQQDIAVGYGFGVYDDSFNKLYTWIENTPKQGLGYVQLWVKLSDYVLSKLNGGSATLYLAVANMQLVDGETWGVSGGALGNTAMDNIANVMDPGVIFTAWAATTSIRNPTLAGQQLYSDPLYGDLGASTIVFTPYPGYSFTMYAIESAYLATKQLESNYAPCTAQSSQTQPTSCTPNTPCMYFTRMLFDFQYNYSCGTSITTLWGINGYIGPLLKAAGWISVSWDDTIVAIVDDALKIMLGVSGANNVNYASWSDGKAGTLSTWIVQGLGAMYSLKVPLGTWRFELHYANAEPTGVYLGVWPPMTYLNGFYHAKYLPASALPHVYVYGTQVQ
ncbi:MAG: hypothetical protein RXR02_05120 [Thermoproteus sp.]